MYSSERSAGFTLLEVLVALAIFTTVMGGLLSTMSQSVRALGAAENEVELLELAQERMRTIQREADTGSPPELGESDGFFPEPHDHMRWTLQVDYFGFPLPQRMSAAEVAEARERSAVFSEKEDQPTSLRLVVLRVYDEAGHEVFDPFTILTADVDGSGAL
jgi:type II secretion system protein I